MAQHRLTTWQKATALVPLALLSGAWTASLAVPTTAVASSEDGATLPDGTSLPTEAIEAPASVSVPGEIAPGVPQGAADSVVANASTSGIPAAALAAYQRAAEVMDAAEASCHVGWPLIAAIGRVESDHGRHGGNRLTDEGVSEPGIYGIPLDGSNGTAEINDTDAGQLDDDPIFDRAVGPMQFIPSTWSVVGVDGDGDGIRNPQDIDDAALATAVYLCSGEEDLSTTQGQRSAVYRYNHSQAYVDLVLSIMRAYSQGEFAAIPNGSYAPAIFTPYYGDAVVGAGTKGARPAKSRGGKTRNGSGGSGTGGGPAGGGEPTGGTEAPTAPDVPGSGGGGGDPTGPVTDPVEEATEPVQETLSALDKAKQTCQDNFTSAEISLLGGLTACGQKILDNGLAGTRAILAGLLNPVGGGGGGGGGLPDLPGL